ncbi:DUF3239 domain-containing protein [Colwellia psychrerythraea]|uniref:DUF3239 domain-containing protein n=1 Tax=Colwellia psychrerythraea TaxID=28229 RepID=A0A099KLR7_COLPS|nr:DUF3239 domain-containing protein [Colwellia psychrerythraea]KGJ90897.1 Protein of unknown function DUF3239 [Colwellia psychrerythraea]
MKFTLDNDTSPTNKSEIILEPLNWLKYKSGIAIPLALSVLICTYFTYSYNKYFFIAVLVLVLINVFYWLRIKEHFKADSTPAIVISETPPLLAVYTNMAKYGDYYPAIKIEKFINKNNYKIGSKVATASIYSVGNEENDYWADFHPLPVNYATSNEAQLNFSLLSFSEDEWQELQAGINQLSATKTEGLYKITNSSSCW